jgi:zinc-binding alcohol dehydrogenase/oxidoreductase
VLGSDDAGILSAVGPQVEGVCVGDEVVIYPGVGWSDDQAAATRGFVLVGVPGQGTYAERIVVSTEQVRPRPREWSWLEAAALSTAGLTAWRALVTCAKAAPGKTILVTGAAGGVATFAVQIGALLAHCTEAQWRPVIGSVSPLAEAAKAHERLDAPDRFGKVLLAIDERRAGA